MDSINVEHITDLFKCKFCKKCYENPIVLPCGDKICKNDLNQIYSQITLDDNDDIPHLRCPSCNESITVPKNGFPIDREMKKLIDIGLDKLSFGEVFDRSKESVHNLAKKIERLETLNSNPKEFVESYFSELKAQVDTKREEFKLKIDRNFQKLIGDIEFYEKECLEGIYFGTDSAVKSEIEVSKECLESYKVSLNSLSVDEDEWEEIALKSKFLKAKLNVFINDLERVYLREKSYQLVADDDDSGNASLLGSLKVKKVNLYFLSIFLNEKMI